MGVMNQVVQLVSSSKGKTPLLHVVNTETGYEERRLESSTWVSTTISGVYQELARIEGFKMLLAYIMGQNDEGVQLKSIPPVLTRVTSSKTKNFESIFTISMCVETDRDRRLPEPTNPLVYIEHFPAMLVFVKPVEGLTTDEKWLWEARKLAEILQHKEQIRTDVYFTAAYENPLQLMCQDNEVWLVKYENEKTIVPLKKENTINVGDQSLQVPPITVKMLAFFIWYFSLLYNCFHVCLNFGTFARSNANLIQKTLKSKVECIVKDNPVLNFVYSTSLSNYNRTINLINWFNKMYR